MRIVIDMQGAQSSGSYNRGIGRYSLALVKAILRNGDKHEVFLALNGLFPETAQYIYDDFAELLPINNICVWSAPSRVAFADKNNARHRVSAELIREAFLASLKPDIILITSLFEGLVDDAISSIGLLSQVPTAVILYDLIPFIQRSPYLDNPVVEEWYLNKVEHLRRAKLYLSISESSRKEGIEYLEFSDNSVVNISTDADAHFKVSNISKVEETTLRQLYGLSQPFIMYTGGIDHRKNIEGLIRAYAMLPSEVLQDHQLAIVCSAQPEAKELLEALARKNGLKSNQLVLTGFVPEDDLVKLYSLCQLFVFPSQHEGFGLPALEAMRCGAAVIGANTTSLPEVIDWQEALFDPYSDESIMQCIKRALTDTAFHKNLLENGKKQSAKFSWDESGRQAIAAMERLFINCEKARAKNAIAQKDKRLKLAYVSPLPPQQSGIADYSAELLPELATHYDIEVIVSSEETSDKWITSSCKVRTSQWLLDNAKEYDRVLYHFGNSEFHQHMFELIEHVPGVVVLHDFFLSGVVAHMDVHGFDSGCWQQELYHSHGYKAFQERFCTQDQVDVIWQYPCNLSVIQAAIGMIVHSPYSLKLAEQTFAKCVSDWSLIPLMRDAELNTTKDHARKILGYKKDDVLVCSFGMLGPTKLNHRLLDAWAKSKLAKNKLCHLVFVGVNDGGEYGEKLIKTISKSVLAKNIKVTGWTDQKVFRQYLAAADIGVQLRTKSRGETSAAVLDCMNYEMATVVNANGSMGYLDDEAVLMIPDEFTDEQLVDVLEGLFKNEEFRIEKGKKARNVILNNHQPKECAAQYHGAIESYYANSKTSANGVLKAIIKAHEQSLDEQLMMDIATSMALNFPPQSQQKQLFIDVSELVQRDVKCGTQGIARDILKACLSKEIKGTRVEPVYASVNRPYYYARSFTKALLGVADKVLLSDEFIDTWAGDTFLGLDLQPQVVLAQRDFYQSMRLRGVKVKFVVYDLLCVSNPEYFIHGAADDFIYWLEVICQSDGVICIAKSVAEEFKEWVKLNNIDLPSSFTVSWFHLGADIKSLAESEQVSSLVANSIDKLKNRTSLLMVGTIEPRKGHAQALDSFDELFAKNIEVNLVIVGKKGWLVDDLVARIISHPQLNKRLFWFEGINDNDLNELYSVSSGLIAASYAEGFGLPLIEAAKHGLPIIARDIPVFREVAGDHAYYFDDFQQELSFALQEWIKLYELNEHPKSKNMPRLSWDESMQQLLQAIEL